MNIFSGGGGEGEGDGEGCCLEGDLYALFCQCSVLKADKAAITLEKSRLSLTNSRQEKWSSSTTQEIQTEEAESDTTAAQYEP